MLDVATITRPLRSAFGAMLAVTLAAGVVGCDGPRDVEVHVRHVGFDPATRSPVIVLEDRRRREALPIWIGAAEAQAIALELDGQRPVRPMTHDLFKSVLEQAGVSLDRVVVESLDEGTYRARLHLRSLRRDFSVDARPSDAIALAVRFARPIFVAAPLMQGAAPLEPVAATVPTDVAAVGGLTVQSLTPELADWFGMGRARGGAVVTDVARPSRDGPLRGDVVLAVDGAAVRSAEEFADRMAAAGARRVPLSVWRGDREIQVRVDARARR